MRVFMCGDHILKYILIHTHIYIYKLAAEYKNGCLIYHY